MNSSRLAAVVLTVGTAVGAMGIATCSGDDSDDTNATDERDVDAADLSDSSSTDGRGDTDGTDGAGDAVDAGLPPFESFSCGTTPVGVGVADDSPPEQTDVVESISEESKCRLQSPNGGVYLDYVLLTEDGERDRSHKRDERGLFCFGGRVQSVEYSSPRSHERISQMELTAIDTEGTQPGVVSVATTIDYKNLQTVELSDWLFRLKSRWTQARCVSTGNEASVKSWESLRDGQTGEFRIADVSLPVYPDETAEVPEEFDPLLRGIRVEDIGCSQYSVKPMRAMLAIFDFWDGTTVRIGVGSSAEFSAFGEDWKIFLQNVGMPTVNQDSWCGWMRFTLARADFFTTVDPP